MMCVCVYICVCVCARKREWKGDWLNVDLWNGLGISRCYASNFQSRKKIKNRREIKTFFLFFRYLSLWLILLRLLLLLLLLLLLPFCHCCLGFWVSVVVKMKRMCNSCVILKACSIKSKVSWFFIFYDFMLCNPKEN